ncbi:hypothetical protein NEMBOFW57_002306 [Staphylotrichum longicolle]|uniref:Protein transport protein SFT2 n=1 Tax=Staphylotrichum longicolle TaxID=669026 RepID=A0AAD4F2T1_9PEZI|nr:hypothetical protein NEMBOFW57_002306 [Staphylotrichum longicolle]
MASTSFRDSINSLGWSRRNADIPVNTAPQGGFLSSLQSLNPFGDRGYVQLPTTEGPGAPLPAPSRREEEEGWFALSRWDRLLIFGACNLGALACFVICFFLFPIISLGKPRKLVVLTVLTLFAGLIQLASLIWYLISYFPMGSSGLRLVSSFGARRAAAWMTS